MLAFLLLFVLFIQKSNSTIPISNTPSGFHNDCTYNQVVLDMFVDLLCPDSKKSHFVLKKALGAFPKVCLRYHLFPLPYHHNAFMVAQSAYTITSALGNDQFTIWAEAMYRNQKLFENEITMNMGQAQVTDRLAKLAMETFGRLTEEEWKMGMSGHGGTSMDDKTRVAWKYACSKGVTGTPIFFLNDVLIDADASWSEQQWKELLSQYHEQEIVLQAAPLPVRELKTIMTKRPVFLLHEEDAYQSYCAYSNLQACEFEHEKSMCCTTQEFCLPQAGCVSAV